MLLMLFLLFMVPVDALTEDTVIPVYFTNGGSLTLDVKRNTSANITNALWKFNDNMLVEWVKDLVPVAYYDTFNGRATLHTDTGRLVIENMSEADSGVYSSTVNHKIQSESYNATLIKEVPEPEVVIRPLTCQATSASCNFVCRADIEGAGPVTYTWKKGDGEWDPTEKDATIVVIKAQHAHVKTFTCRIKNPVSEKESKPKTNLMYKEVAPNGSEVGKVVGGVLGTLVIVAAVVGFVFWKKKNRNVEHPAANGHPARPEELPLNSSGPEPNPDPRENP